MNNYGMQQGMGMLPQQGMQYGRPMVKGTQPLTPEQIALLKSNGGTNLEITDLDLIAAVCTHRDPSSGMQTLNPQDDGSYTCTICNANFHIVEFNQPEIEAMVNQMNNVLQSIKTLYIDIPAKTAQDFFVLLPLLSKVPMLYKIAANQFSKYENGPMTNQNGHMQSMQLLNGIYNPAMMGGMPGMQQQPMGMPGYPQQQQQPMGMPGYPQQQPMGMPGYPQQQPMGMPGYPQQQQQPIMQPMQPTAMPSQMSPQQGVYPQAQAYTPTVNDANHFTNNPAQAGQQPNTPQQQQEVHTTKNFNTGC